MSSVHERWFGSTAILLATVAACQASEPSGNPAATAASAASATAAAGPTTVKPAGPASTGPTMTTIPIVQRKPTVVALPAPVIELPQQESFTLIDAGKQPRAPLRYRPAPAGFTFTAETKLSARHLENGAFTKPLALPAIHDGFAVSPGATGGLALRGLAGTAAGNSPEVDAYLASWRSLIQDRQATLAFDDRGTFKDIAFPEGTADKRNAAAKDELVQRLLVAVVPLPSEPVGPGASWRAVTILRQRPGYAKQTATYTLVSASPTAWKLRVKLMRVGEEQHIADPSLPADTTADLLAMFRLLEGDVTIDPTKPLIRGSLKLESRLHVKLQTAGQPAVEHMTEDTGTIVLAHGAAAPAKAP